GIDVVLYRATTDRLLQEMRGHEIDCVIGRAAAAVGLDNMWHQVLYAQRPALVAHPALARRIARTRQIGRASCRERVEITAEGIRDFDVTGVPTCALPIWHRPGLVSRHYRSPAAGNAGPRDRLRHRPRRGGRGPGQHVAPGALCATAGAGRAPRPGPAHRAYAARLADVGASRLAPAVVGHAYRHYGYGTVHAPAGSPARGARTDLLGRCHRRHAAQ